MYKFVFNLHVYYSCTSCSDESSLRKLLDQLLELQECLLHQNIETRSALLDEPEEEADEEDEEILSDEADGSMEENTTITQAARIGKRKRQRELERGGRDYESYIDGVHERLSPFVYETIDKWNKKLRLTTDKTTSKVRERDQTAHLRWRVC